MSVSLELRKCITGKHLSQKNSQQYQYNSESEHTFGGLFCFNKNDIKIEKNSSPKVKLDHKLKGRKPLLQQTDHLKCDHLLRKVLEWQCHLSQKIHLKVLVTQEFLSSQLRKLLQIVLERAQHNVQDQALDLLKSHAVEKKCLKYN